MNTESLIKNIHKFESDIEGLNSSLDSKANKNEVFSMANMGQDVKEAMTGGSVAVVGRDSILFQNIVDKQVTTDKASFVKNNAIYYKEKLSIKTTTAGTWKSVDVVLTDLNVSANEQLYIYVKDVIGVVDSSVVTAYCYTNNEDTNSVTSRVIDKTTLNTFVKITLTACKKIVLRFYISTTSTVTANAEAIFNEVILIKGTSNFYKYFDDNIYVDKTKINNFSVNINEIDNKFKTFLVSNQTYVNAKVNVKQATLTSGVTTDTDKNYMIVQNGYTGNGSKIAYYLEFSRGIPKSNNGYVIIRYKQTELLNAYPSMGKITINRVNSTGTWSLATYNKILVNGYCYLVVQDLQENDTMLILNLEIENLVTLTSTGYIGALDICITNLKNKETTINNIYVKPTGGDFNNPMLATKSIKDSSDINIYNVYVSEGDYNIFSAWTQEDITGTAITGANVGWNLPDYVNLIGVGDVDKIICRCELPDNYDTSIIEKASCLNLMRNNTLENITFIGKNTRYTIHDESSNWYKNWVRKVKGCKIIHNGNQPNMWQYHGAWMEGCSSGSASYFEECEFRSVRSAYGFHNNTNFTKPSYHKFYNCKFFNDDSTQDSVGFVSMGSGVKDKVVLEGCYIQHKIGLTELNQGNGIDIELMGHGNSRVPINNPKNATIYITDI